MQENYFEGCSVLSTQEAFAYKFTLKMTSNSNGTDDVLDQHIYFIYERKKNNNHEINHQFHSFSKSC